MAFADAFDHLGVWVKLQLVRHSPRLRERSGIEARLIRVVGLSENLLRSRADLLAEAYDLQAKRVAYVERAGTEAGDEVI
jgi:hypothetical protein